MCSDFKISLNGYYQMQKSKVNIQTYLSTSMILIRYSLINKKNIRKKGS